jgi:hypothetical protein
MELNIGGIAFFIGVGILLLLLAWFPQFVQLLVRLKNPRSKPPTFTIRTRVGITIFGVALVGLGFVLLLRSSAAGPAEPAPTVKPTSAETPTEGPTTTLAALTDMPMPTATPTPRPIASPTPACPPGARCYDVDFSDLQEGVWCHIPPGVELSGGQLVISAAEGTSPELRPCEEYREPLGFVEVILTVDQSTGTPGYAHAGIEGSLRDGYFSLKLDTAGNGYVYHKPHDQEGQEDMVFSVGGTGTPHTLRAEWTGNQVIFFVDGSKLDVEIDSVGWGTWFSLVATAPEKSSIQVSLDRIHWSVLSP